MRTRSVGDVWSGLVGPLGPAASAAVLTAACSSAAVTAVRTRRRVGAARGAAVGVVTADLVGGLVAFQLPGTRAQYSRSPTRSRMTFALVHLQPFLLPLIGEGPWRRAAARYLGAVVATAVLERRLGHAPSRRRVATGLALVAGAADAVFDTSGQRWFGPVYLLKLVGGHAGIPRAAGTP